MPTVAETLSKFINSSQVNSYFTDEFIYIDSPNYLSAKRVYRDIVDSGNSSSESPDNTTPCWLQGMCCINETKIIYALYNVHKYSNNVILKEVNISTGAVLRTATLALGHANALTYNSVTNKIYCAVLSTNSGGVETTVSQVKVIDYETLTIVKTVDFSATLTVGAVSYDFINDTMYVSNGSSLYSWDLSDDTLTLVCTFSDLSGGSSTFQNTLVYNSILYVLRHNPSFISCYDLTGNNLKVINIPQFLGNYFVGEVEAISFTQTADTETFYLASTCSEEYQIKLFPQIFKGNIKRSYFSSSRITDKFSSYSLYVDINSTAVNPDGSSTNKFKEICEAVLYAQSKDVKPFTIEVAAGTYSFAYLKYANLEIVFAAGAKVKGMVSRHSNLLLMSPTFLPSNAISTAFNIYRNSNVRIDTPTFENINNSILADNQYSDLYISGSITYTGCTYTYVVQNTGSSPIKYNTNSTLIVKDISSSSNPTKWISVALENVNDITDFDAGVRYNILNNKFKNIEFMYEHGTIKDSTKVRLVDFAAGTEYVLATPFYNGDDELLIYKISLTTQADGNIMLTSRIICTHDQKAVSPTAANAYDSSVYSLKVVNIILS